MKEAIRKTNVKSLMTASTLELAGPQWNVSKQGSSRQEKDRDKFEMTRSSDPRTIWNRFQLPNPAMDVIG